MGADSMLTQTVYLDPHPGGIRPELHLKQGTNSMRMRLMISTGRLPDGVLTDFIYKPCILRATLPDGTEFFATSACDFENRRICVRLYSTTIRRMTRTAGRYKCTLTIVNTEEHLTRENYMNFDFMTVLPFTVVVHERAE